ncbi:MAG: DUF3459 domain-containing protein [Planctomycetes bacterium]|nr:DUF3459 domain-containing protein [Planctomycetota bacterium]
MIRIKHRADSGLSTVAVLSALFWASAIIGCMPGLAAEDWPPAPQLEIPAGQLSGPAPPSVDVEPAGTAKWRCAFRFRPSQPAKSVTLAGTFNGWNRAATPLSGPDANGYWRGNVVLGPGRHLYKFVVDGQNWFADPENRDQEDDGHQGHNSVLRLGRLAQMRTSEAQCGDGQIETAGFEHRPDRPRYFQPLAAGRALLRYRTLAHDVERVWAAVKGNGLTEMHVVQEDPLFALWETEVNLPAQTTRSENVHSAQYTFVLADGDQRGSDPETYWASFTEQGIFQTPDWAKHAVWYQIMLERFRNGDPSNDPDYVRPWTSAWFTPSPWEEQSGQTFYKYYVFFRYYGGDLAGLVEKLEYLRNLGVNALYLNPVFEAESHHKYHTISYVHIDDQFGHAGDYDAVAAAEDVNDPSTWQWTESDQRFLAFLKKAHKLGFHVIIDGVFNHVGARHPAFQDVKKNGRQSRYADWFEITSWEPFHYKGWAGVTDLPEFKKNATGFASNEVTQHIYAVTRRWMDPNGDGDPSDGIDGWRLDVPNEVPAPFWVGWRELVKSINPDAYITGEIWDRAEMWLDGKHFDAVMNYEFARAVVDWIMDREQKIKVSELDRRLRELRLAYPQPATLVMQNLMNSHDTDRLVSMALNPDRAYDHANRVQDNGPNYDNAKPPPEAYAKARLAALLQMTYVGAPMVYYGDEVGMWGADDPTCRKPMLWKDLEPYDKPEDNHVMAEHLEFYRRAIHLRRAHPALRTGAFQTLLADDAADVWVFLRWDKNERLLVALNASGQVRDVVVTLPPGSPNVWQGVFGAESSFKAKDGALGLRVPGTGGVVLHAATPK